MGSWDNVQINQQVCETDTFFLWHIANYSFYDGTVVLAVLLVFIIEGFCFWFLTLHLPEVLRRGVP